ncbi:AcrR family transcriptional regulator [Saccharomonospora amisosensis]|uniref:AcrR family transcriptional regulator n=1 Tax=Saccharomonospora amisosensis TaxID=1128677 RepID=A0A7X5URJ7_9PSEU|nr:TetR/AcrR family transcriptional regulator [Saccharomonospora amisosensis]NIJ12906.1 AcrR family transcriptional regulator [Saccharomonospora amisosensis]
MSKHSSAGGTRVVRRVLSSNQAATRDKLIDAAIEVATESGYEGAGVREVAARAGVSPATAYQHVSSKDQLLIEALLALGDRVTENVRARQPSSSDPAGRLMEVFARIMRQAAQKPLLYQALFRAYVGGYPAVAGSDDSIGFGPERAAWIGAALRAGGSGGYGDAEIDSAARVLSTMFLGAIVGVAAGRDADEVTDILREAVHRLLPDRT